MRVFALSWLIATVVFLGQTRLPSLVTMVVLVVLIIGMAWRYPVTRTSIAGVVVGVASLTIQLIQLGSTQLHAAQVSEDLTLSLQVAGIPSRDDRRIRFEADVISCVSCKQSFGPKRIQLSWYDQTRVLHAGDVWTMTVRLKPISGLRNPNGFDAVRWSIARGLHAKGYIRNFPPPVRKRGAERTNVAAVRERISERLQDLSSGQRYTALVQALTIGVKDGVSTETWALLRKTGTAHLLAISGLHISLVAGWGFVVGRLLGYCIRYVSQAGKWHVFLPDSRFLSLICSLFFAFAYALFSGFELPTQRALIMLLVWVLASWFFRILAPASALALALMGILLSNALSPLSVGFWLSFGTVWILFLLHRGWQRSVSTDLLSVSAFRHRFVRVLAAAKTHALLGVILLPITAWFFQTGALVAPIANLLAVPWVGLVVVPLCFLTVLLSFWFPIAAAWVLEAADWALVVLVNVLSTLAEMGAAAITLTLPGTAVLFLCLLGLVCVFAPRGLAVRWFALPLLTPALLFNLYRAPMTGFEVHVVDVGQGLAVLVLSDNQTLLYDTGGKVSESLSMFESAVMPYLHGHGRRTIDKLVISHADADHSAGAADVVRRFPDVQVHGSAPVPGLADTVISRCEAGQQWSDGDVYFSFLHPGTADSGSENDLSCVLLIHVGGSRVLLPGDIEGYGESLLESRLAGSAKPFPVTLLIAPHHGSNTSSTDKLLHSLKPEHVVFPAGRANRYGFPHTDVQLRYKLVGAKSYVTGIEGAMSFVFGPEGLRQPPISWWQSHRRFWHGIVNSACSPEKGVQLHWLRLHWLARKGQILCGK